MKLSIVEILLQEQGKEDQKSGWIFVKMVKWPIRELYESKLKHRLSSWLKEVEAQLGEAKYVKKFMGGEEEVYVCEPKQGPILGEYDESAKE